MAKSPPYRPFVDALIFVNNQERFLVVNHDGINLRIQDDKPQLSRPPAELLDIYLASYQQAVEPHLVELRKLRHLALTLRQLTSKQLNLP